MLAACVVCAASVASCGGKRPLDLGVHDAMLGACPASPNCVSSGASDAAHHVEAYVLSAPPDDAWRVLRQEVASLPRTAIVAETASYLHAESVSGIFGFVDDLELHLRASDGLVAIRSASRIGHSDLGVNRRRVERLRQSLRSRGVVR